MRDKDTGKELSPILRGDWDVIQSTSGTIGQKENS